tara:strand:+ start:106 stop:528 length:423 start_codon:yes stop_codon:yes gene_type:complete
MSLSKYRSKVVSITLSIRNITVRHNFYFQIIGSFLILSLLSYLHFMQPPSLDVISFTQVDKLAHFLMFFFTMMWFMYVSKKWLVTAVSLIFLALVLELIQMNYIINRSFDWFDWIADGIGIVLCFLLLPFLIDKYFDSSV